jgi:hypothetical protein
LVHERAGFVGGLFRRREERLEVTGAVGQPLEEVLV